MELIKFIEGRLKDCLPGWKAQSMMIPEGREQIAVYDELHPASVLIAIYRKDGEWVFPLIQRTLDGFAHSGQIALPGGRKEGDESVEETALREAWEEVNIVPKEVSILGQMSPLPIPVSKHLVQPILGYLNSPPKLKPEPKEVAGVFEVGLSELLDKEIQFEDRTFKGTRWEIPYLDIHGHKVWGATAMILSELRELLKGAPYQDSDQAGSPARPI